MNLDHESIWMTERDQALRRSAEADKPVLLDFFLPG